MCDALSDPLFTKNLLKFMKQAEQMQESDSTIKEKLLWAEAYSLYNCPVDGCKLTYAITEKTLAHLWSSGRNLGLPFFIGGSVAREERNEK